MNCKQILALVLVFTMVLSMAGCGSPQPTTEPTTQPTTVPTTAPLTPAELYAAGAEKLQNATGIRLAVQMTQTVDINGTVFTYATEQVLTCSGMGTDHLVASLRETEEYGDEAKYVYKETFEDGKLYTTVDDTYYFSGSMTAEACMERYIPAVLLTADLYGQIQQDGDTLTFSEPLSGEPWLVPEYAELVEASGTATLASNQDLSEATYHVIYRFGGTTVTWDIETDIQTDPGTVPVYRDGEAEYVELEYVDAPRMLNQAVGFILQSSGKPVTSTSAISMISYAAGVIRNQSTTIQQWGEGTDYMSDVEVSVFIMDPTDELEFHQVEHFEDGKYTYSVDDSEPTAQDGVTASQFETYCTNSMLGNLPAMDHWQGAKAEDLGSLYYLELTGSDDMGDSMNAYICNTLWQQPDYLDNLTDSYETKSVEMYLALDKYTGMPTAVGISYEGVHTLNGNEYPLTLQVDQSFDMASDSVYEELAGHTPEVPAPEEQATPLFYHVTGENGAEMWLLGTIHVGDARTSYLPQRIYDAFDAADALAVEYNSDAFETALDEDDELSDQVSSCYFYGDGTTTEDHIEDEELFEYAVKLLKASGNYHMNAPYLKAYLWSSSIDNFVLGQGHDLSSTQGVDNQLLQRARDQGKTILEVESGLFQIQMLTGFSDALQEQLLLESVGSDPVASMEGTRELFEMWCAGDEAALIAYLNDNTEDPEMTDEERALVAEYKTAMETDRNADMLDVAIQYLESGDVVFYAVGLAHLLAEDGLVNTLRAAGYTVELVPYE